MILQSSESWWCAKEGLGILTTRLLTLAADMLTLPTPPIRGTATHSTEKSEPKTQQAYHRSAGGLPATVSSDLFSCPYRRKATRRPDVQTLLFGDRGLGVPGFAIMRNSEAMEASLAWEVMMVSALKDL